MSALWVLAAAALQLSLSGPVGAQSATIADAGPDQTLTDTDGDGAEPVQLDGTGSTSGAGIVSYTWSEGATQIATSAQPNPVSLEVGTHTIVLTVVDEVGQSDEDTVVVTVESTAPTADAGPDQTLTDTDGDGTESVQLDGTGSTSELGIQSYTWSEGGTQIATGAEPGPVSLDVGTHTIALTVVDEVGQSDEDTIVVTIAAPDGAPSANAGPDQTLADDDGDGVELVQLDGTQSTDDSGIVSYTWSENGAQIATGAQPAPVSLPVGTHTILLTVVDEAQQSDEDTVVVTIGEQSQRNFSDVLPELTPNQRSTAMLLGDLCPRLVDPGLQDELTSGEQELLARCSSLMSLETSSSEAIEAIESMTGEEIAAQQTNALDYSSVQQNNIGNRIVALRGGSGGGVSIAGLNLSHDGQRIPLAQLASLAGRLVNGGGASADETGEVGGGLLSNRLGIFVNGNLRTGDKDRTANEAGFDFDSWGITAGADYRFTDSLVAGAALGYNESETRFDGAGGGIDGDSLSVSLYGTYFSDNLYFDFVGNSGSVDYDSARRIVYTDAGGTQEFTAVGRTDGDLDSLGVSFGYDFRKGGATFGPTLSLNSIEVDLDPFAETGGGGLGLAFAEQQSESRTAQGGFRFNYALSREWGVLSPHARVSFVREMENESQVLIAQLVNDPFVNDPGQPSPPITIVTDEPDESYVRWGMGVSAVFVNGISAFVDYESYAGFSGLSSHELSFGVRFERSLP